MVEPAKYLINGTEIDDYPSDGKVYDFDHDSMKWVVRADVVPDISWLKADIQVYMVNHSIDYSESDTKAALLTKIEEA